MILGISVQQPTDDGVNQEGNEEYQDVDGDVAWPGIARQGFQLPNI